METHSGLFSAPWLRQIIGLIQSNASDEAYALAEYFPATIARKLVQCVALLSLHNTAEANTLLKTIDATMQILVPDISYLAKEVNIDLQSVSQEAIQNKHLDIGQLCLEADLLLHPESVQTFIDGIIKLASVALNADNANLSRTCLNRALQLDHSPSRNIHYAEAVLTHPKIGSYNSLSAFAKDLISEALDQLPKEDADNRLKIAILLARDGETLKEAHELFRQLLHDHPSLKAHMSDLLLSLVEEKPNFSIIDFLLELDPGNLVFLAQALIAHYRRSHKSSYLPKFGPN